MKKALIIFIVSFMAFGCSNPQTPKENLISKAEEELKKNMNDANSYEFVNFEEDLQKEAELETAYKNIGMDEEYRSYLRYYRLKYRGKNMLGALILEEVYVISNNDLSFVKLQDIE